MAVLTTRVGTRVTTGHIKSLSDLPNFPLFHKLVGFCHRLQTSHHAIRNIKTKFNASHLQLLSDVLSVRKALWFELDLVKQEKLGRQEEVFISLLAPPGYEFTVGFLAILALGAVAVPLSHHVPASEASYFIQNSTSSAIITTKELSALAAAMQANMHSEENFRLAKITIDPYLYSTSLRADEIFIAADWSLDPNGASLAIFTSGTTGRPEAVILPREILCSGAQTLVEHYNLSTNDTLLHCMPLHHVAGVTVNLAPFLISGATIEFHTFDVDTVWDSWRTRDITIFSGVPTMFTRLMRHWEDHLKSGSASHDYLRAVRSLRFMMSGTAALPKPLRVKWLDLMAGKPILERYGSTELGSVVLTSLKDSNLVPSGSVGTPIPGSHIKLSESGEILVKAPGMILRYHNNPKATSDAFDKAGFFRTGDIGRMEDQFIFILGRASIDIIKSGGYKISALDVERELLGLDYISEAVVVGVPDEEFGQRVAAAVVLRDLQASLTIERLRSDVRRTLSAYKLPTLLYVAKELKKTASGKVQKKVLRSEVFKSGTYGSEIQVFHPAKKVSVQARL